MELHSRHLTTGDNIPAVPISGHRHFSDRLHDLLCLYDGSHQRKYNAVVAEGIQAARISEIGCPISHLLDASIAGSHGKELRCFSTATISIVGIHLSDFKGNDLINNCFLFQASPTHIEGV